MNDGDWNTAIERTWFQGTAILVAWMLKRCVSNAELSGGEAVRSDPLLDALDRIRDAAVKAFVVSRASARHDPIGRVQAEREFDALFGVIQDEKRKASNATHDGRRIRRTVDGIVGTSGGAK